jgi:serine/threonine protein kinase
MNMKERLFLTLSNNANIFLNSLRSNFTDPDARYRGIEFKFNDAKYKIGEKIRIEEMGPIFDLEEVTLTGGAKKIIKIHSKKSSIYTPKIEYDAYKDCYDAALVSISGDKAIIMDKIYGISLSDFLKQEESALDYIKHNFLQITDIIINLAILLEKYHGKDLIHSDIRPENIILHPDDCNNGFYTVHIIGFEFAQKANSRLQHPPFLSQEYKAPESKGDRPSVSFNSDIYSLAIIAFKLLFGTNCLLRGRTEFYTDNLALLPSEELPENSIGRNLADLKDIICYFLSKALSESPSKRPDIEVFKIFFQDLRKLEEMPTLNMKDYDYSNLVTKLRMMAISNIVSSQIIAKEKIEEAKQLLLELPPYAESLESFEERVASFLLGFNLEGDENFKEFYKKVKDGTRLTDIEAKEILLKIRNKITEKKGNAFNDELKSLIAEHAENGTAESRSSQELQLLEMAVSQSQKIAKTYEIQQSKNKNFKKLLFAIQEELTGENKATYEDLFTFQIVRNRQATEFPSEKAETVRSGFIATTSMDYLFNKPSNSASNISSAQSTSRNPYVIRKL